MRFSKTSLAASIITMCLVTNYSHAQMQDRKTQLVHTVDSILKSQVNANKIPGAVIEIKIGDEVILKQAYGYAQKYDYNHQLLAHPDTMATGTLFDIASLTKVVGTTTSVMLLVDRGLVHIDDPVSKFIKAFASPDKSAITIRH